MNMKTGPIKNSLKKLLSSVLLLGFIAGAIEDTTAQSELSREPILRIETGMHTDSIYDIGVDASGRYLVTASTDRTVRVWELPAGKLLRVFRAFIPDNLVREVDRVAISPNGLTIAAGMPDGDGNTSLYFFDRDSGRLIRRLPESNIGVISLTFSKDNHYLAETYFSRQAGRPVSGVRVFDLQSYTFLGEDRVETTPTSNGRNVSFDQTNKLIAAFSDSFRLYALEGGKLRRLVKKPTEDEQPVSVEFSPDNSRIAVISYRKSNPLDYRARVLSAKDLTELYVANTTGMHGHHIAWSYDGKTLYAGAFDKKELRSTSFIRAWDDGGRGEYRDIAIRQGYLTGLNALRDGGFVYSSGFFGIVGTDSQEKLFMTANTVKYYYGLCSPKEDALRFSFTGEIKGTYAQFSLTALRLDPSMGPAAEIGCEYPFLFKAENWPDNLRGVFNKIHDLRVAPNYAITPDHQGIVQATSDFGLRLYGGDGMLRWQFKPSNSSFIRSVAVSGDGRFVIAQHSDGTIRWYRMAEGHHVLTLFVHSEKKRWVAWTP